MAAPRTFEAAQTWLKGRANLPTSLTSAELALAKDFPAQVKAQTFFSARVTSVDILNKLRDEVDLFAAGETDLASARMRLKTFLGAQGIPADDVGMTPEAPPGVSDEDWQARKEIVNLASTRRLDLIVRQNAAMAQAIGREQVSMDPAVLERWPNWRYIARMDGRERTEHGRLNNLVLPKTDPFWATHTGPWEWGCRCDKEDADQIDVDTYGLGKSVVKEHEDGSQTCTIDNPGTGQVVNLVPSPSGFVFRVPDGMGKVDWSTVQDGPLKQQAMTGWFEKHGGIAKNPTQVVSFQPGQATPFPLDGAPLSPLPPPANWADLTDPTLAEPPILKVSGKKTSAGCVVVEPDGRVWIVSPKGGYGGYTNTFPKGGAEKGVSLQANAVREVFEESGLQVEVKGYLGDYERSTSVTRYYMAVRKGGAPWMAGVESEAVHLVPQAKLKSLLNMPIDQKIAAEAMALLKQAEAAGSGDLVAGLAKIRKVAAPVVAEVTPTASGAAQAGAGLKRIPGKLGGSTGAYLAQDEQGLQYVVKEYGGNELQVKNEWLASQFYQHLGVPVAESRLVQIEGKLAVAAKRLENVRDVGSAQVDWAAGRAQVKTGFVADAFLGNWDVAGQGFDNVLVQGRKGTVYRVDHGGALLFRAQGAAKGAAFGAEVTELASLRDAAINPQTARLFAQVTDADIAKQIRSFTRRLKATDIARLVEGAGLPKAAAQELTETLAARRAWLAKWEKEYSRQAKEAVKQAAVRRVTHRTPTDVTRAARVTAEGLTVGLRRAVGSFTGSGYHRINSNALAGKAYRELDSAIAKLPGYTGLSARGIHDVPNAEAMFKKWQTGEWAHVEWKAYSSSGIQPGKKFSDSNGFLFVIQNHGMQGGYVAPISTVKSEAELLYGRNSRFVVRGWSRGNGSRRILLLEEVEGSVPLSQPAPAEFDYAELKRKWKAEMPADSEYWEADKAFWKIWMGGKAA